MYSGVARLLKFAGQASQAPRSINYTGPCGMESSKHGKWPANWAFALLGPYLATPLEMYNQDFTLFLSCGYGVESQLNPSSPRLSSVHSYSALFTDIDRNQPGLCCRWLHWMLLLAAELAEDWFQGWWLYVGYWLQNWLMIGSKV